MDKRQAKKFAYGVIGAFVDAELPDIFENVERDPDVKYSEADLDRIHGALREVIDELRAKGQDHI